MVQVIKEPIGTKGARLSTQISIAGRLLVFLPQDDHIGVSQKIPGGQRDELRARTATPGWPTRRRLHFAHQWRRCKSDAELADDIGYLRKAWARIKDASTRCHRSRYCTRT
jgi:ribonuclease G